MSKVIQFSIPEKPDFSKIANVSRNLNQTSIETIIEFTKKNIERFNVAQFLYILDLITFSTQYKLEAFQIIRLYMESKYYSPLDALLQIENYLASRVLKKFEDQESYSEFYSIFDSYYKTRFKQASFKNHASGSGILFFVHNPVFLAHTNPLLEILEHRTCDYNISIASLGSNFEFEQKCASMKVNFIHLKGNTFLEKLRNLEAISSDYKHIVWQCLPVFLSFASARISNISWWSFKFNPPISQVRKCITSLPTSETEQTINNNVWHNFTPGFNLKNTNQSPGNWLKRNGVIGAFCREELIDDLEYWKVLAKLLTSNPKLSFKYCGRTQIHEKWVARFGINREQVSYLGWLEAPEQALLNVAVVLDTFKIRHGLLGMEAMAAGIPIIYPEVEKNFGGLVDLYKRLPKTCTVPDPDTYASFKSIEAAKLLIERAALDQHTNESIASKQKQIINAFPRENFQKFVSVLSVE